MERWRRKWDSLRVGTQFRVLFLMAYVPVLLAGSVLMVALYVEARRNVFDQAERQAQLAYASLWRWYEQQLDFLAVLATDPAIRAGPNREAYHELLRINDVGAHGSLGLSLLNDAGQTLLTTFRPYGSPPVDMSGVPEVMQALKSGHPTLSGYASTPLSSQPLISLYYPFNIDGERRLLAVHYSPQYIAAYFTAEPFPGRVIVSLLDREGRRLALSQLAGPLGERVDSPAVRYVLQHPQGNRVLRWADGQDRITAFYHVPPFDWIVAASIPEASTLGMVRRMLVAILAIGILGFGIVFCMLQLGIRRTSRLIALLVDNAKRLGNGDLSVRVPPLPTYELDQLGRSFNQMAEEISRAHSSLEAEVEARTRELRNAIEQLKSLDRLKDTFLSTISHEMKTPLSLIIGYTELLLDKHPDEQLLKGIQDGSRRLTTHINNMLDYSALLGDSLPLYCSEVSIPEVARNALDIMETELKLAQLRVLVQIDPQVPPVYGDSRRITQMFLELLDNARKFTPAGGTVGVNVNKHNGNVRIEVCDTGEGIKPEDRERIWEAFNQIQTTQAVRKGGLGLGLTIVKKLAELHHGHVHVESQPGKGSRFTIDLPTDENPCN